MREAQHAVQLDPLSVVSRRALLSRLVFAHRYDEALEESRHLLEMQPDDADAHYYAAIAWTGKEEHAQAITEHSEELAVPLKESALVYAALGDLDRAYEYLERAFRTEPASLYSLIVDPGSEPLRKDPRWNALMRKLKHE